MGIFEKFKFGFKKSAENIKSGLREIIVKKEIDDDTLNKIEEFLISSDVGIDAASEIKSIIAEKKIDPNNETVDEINLILKNYILELMTPLERKDFFENKEKLNITLVSGVNGVGKTTTIGKIGKIFKDNGSEILFSACDTFRAAAIEQLEAWSSKVGVPIVKSDPGSDPASVAYKSIEYAKNNNIKRVLIDTAGRLQNKKNLMDEFKKIANVIKKTDETAPHDVVLVLDATSGQNIINQLEEFNKIIKITGLIMTKLDGTAKGGVVIGITDRFKIPIKYVGVGEKVGDLKLFHKGEFVSSFFD